MPFKHHGSVNLCMECARARNHATQARKLEYNEEKEQRLQVQVVYQTPHITRMRDIKFFV